MGIGSSVLPGKCGGFGRERIMYKIKETEDREKYILLLPAMLDAHFPLLKYAFYSRNYHPVILENEEGITDTGLRYVNHDMCYPAILNVGQMVAALKSGAFDTERTVLLMPQAGDACRGSNYISVLRRAVAAAGFPEVRALSLNAKGLEKENRVKLDAGMVWRAFFGLFYSDILMLLKNQVEPYEKESGAAAECHRRWQNLLAEDLKRGRHLTCGAMRRNFLRMAEEFSAIPRTHAVKQKIGIVGELYVKYCHLGNWNLEKFLREEDCEYYINGLSWYVLYYIDTHLAAEGGAARLLYGIGQRFLEHYQKKMIKALRDHGFYSADAFTEFKRAAEGYVSFHCTTGDGWLIGAEAVAHIRGGYRKVIAAQPFDCMPNHVCGRGLYPSLQRKLPEGQLVSVNVDASGSKLNYYNRIKMLIDAPEHVKRG